MSVNNYLITLKPLTPYFFGGENTFGEDNVNYFVRSNYLPQQTTILGFLRYELLMQNDLLGTDPKIADWKNLIGESSFQKKDGSFVSDFGAIKKISPVFLSDGKHDFICQSFDWGIADHKGNDKNYKKLFPLEYSISRNAETVLAKHISGVPVLKAGNEPFRQKAGTKQLWVSADGTIARQWDYENKKTFDSNRGFNNGFFIACEQVGIYRKVKRTSSDTGDFYKMVRYNIADEFAFAFFAEIDLPQEKNFGSRIVTMGGERSVFQMTAKRTDRNFSQTFSRNTFNKGRTDHRKAIVLTSDTYAADNVSALYDFAITETTPFRSIQTLQQGNGDYIRIKGGAITKTNQLLHLLKRGSIFFGDDLTGLKKAFENPTFQNIGYNYFIEL